ncbi:hypothetical protein [Oscillatoria sp. HE19RPO]|nr:hypothetical protein [Oscillatoria sp. HE19RPO]
MLQSDFSECVRRSPACTHPWGEHNFAGGDRLGSRLAIEDFS